MKKLMLFLLVVSSYGYSEETDQQPSKDTQVIAEADSFKDKYKAIFKEEPSEKIWQLEKGKDRPRDCFSCGCVY